MAVTAALVHIGHNHLRYLITSTGGVGGSVTLTTTGGATPDLLTDSLAGPIKQIALAFTQGYGKLPAGAFTQAQARALWLNANAIGSLGVVANAGSNLPIAICRVRSVERDASSVMRAEVDANVDGGGHPTIIVTTLNDGTGYLDVEIPGARGD